jgi:hypothetical protein
MHYSFSKSTKYVFYVQLALQPLFRLVVYEAGYDTHDATHIAAHVADREHPLDVV